MRPKAASRGRRVGAQGARLQAALKASRTRIRLAGGRQLQATYFMSAEGDAVNGNDPEVNAVDQSLVSLYEMGTSSGVAGGDRAESEAGSPALSERCNDEIAFFTSRARYRCLCPAAGRFGANLGRSLRRSPTCTGKHQCLTRGCSLSFVQAT